MRWTKEDIDFLISKWGKGPTAQQIANSFSPPRSRNAVIGQAHRLGLDKAPQQINKTIVTAKNKTPRKTAPKINPNKQEPKETQVDFSSATTLFDLHSNQCTAVIGIDSFTNLALYCGKPVYRTSFCKLHHGLFRMQSNYRKGERHDYSIRHNIKRKTDSSQSS